MDKIVVRQHPIGLLFGGIFAGAAVLFAVGFTSEFLTKGISINGVISKNPWDLAGVTGFLTIFLAVGLGIVAYVHNTRVEMSAEEIVQYDAFSRIKTALPWGDVTSIKAIREKTKHWVVEANGAPITLSGTPWPPEALITGLARWARPDSLGEPAAPKDRPTEEIVLRFHDGRLYYPMFFCLLWNGFLLAMLIGLIASGGLSTVSHGSMIFLVLWLGFCGVGYFLWQQTWGVYLRAHVTLSPYGIAYQAASGPELTMDWDDVQCVAEFTMDNMSYDKSHLVVVSDSSGMCLSADLSEFGRARTLILDALSATARVVLLDRTLG